MSTYEDSTNQSREIFFEKINGKNVFVVADLVKDSKQLVLMSHGFRGDSCGPARQFVDFSALLNKSGISTVRFDQPNSGNSEGEYLDSSFNEWVQTTTTLAEKYLRKGFQVILMGQSMGASTSVIASAQPQLQGQIPALLLWVPDPKSNIPVEPKQIYEEDGQQYYGKFWQEARESDFCRCFDLFKGKIHLVYGQDDRYISLKLRQQIIEKAKVKKAQIVILEDEDHSPWKYENAQRVMNQELAILKSL